MWGILDRVDANDDIPFDTNRWRIERTTVEAGEKDLTSLAARSGKQTASGRAWRSNRQQGAALEAIRSSDPVRTLGTTQPSVAESSSISKETLY